MVARLSAAVLLTGLALATPSLAETPVLESSYSLDLREGERLAVSSLDGAPDADTIIAQLPAIDLPAPLSGLAQQAIVESGATSNVLIEVAQDGRLQVEIPDALLMPLAVVLEEASPASFNLFAIREDSENFSWMVVGLGDSDSLTTGSVPQDSDFQPVTAEHGLDGPASRIVSPLTDDALHALELAAP